MRWIDLVNRYGGRHHGYFLPSEGAKATARWRCSSFPKPGKTTKSIDATSASTRNSSRPIACATRAAASSDTSSFMRPMFGGE